MRLLDFPQVDPKSIHFKFDFDIKSVIEKSVWMSGMAAQQTGDFYLMNFEDKDGEPNYKILSKSPEFFWKLPYQCPQDADLAYLKEFSTPRPVPSALAIPPLPGHPEARLVVSKPNLCDTCTHRLSRAINGQCAGKFYESL